MKTLTIEMKYHRFGVSSGLPRFRRKPEGWRPVKTFKTVSTNAGKLKIVCQKLQGATPLIAALDLDARAER